MICEKKIIINRTTISKNRETVVLEYLLKENEYNNLHKTSLRKFGVGVPDLVYDDGEGNSFIEIKCNGGKLSKSQILWIEKNCDKNIIILHAKVIDCGDEFIKKFPMVVYLDKRQTDFIKYRCIKFSDWIKKLIDKAIKLDENNLDIINIFDEYTINLKLNNVKENILQDETKR